MRKLLAVLALAPGFAAATPITYEFTGSLVHSSAGQPHSYASGAVTFDMDALMTHVGYVESEGTWSLSNEIQSPILSMNLQYGDNYEYASGVPSYGSLNAYWSSDSPSRTEWMFGAGLETESGSFVSVYLERRCEPQLCPWTLPDFLGEDDLLNFQNMPGILSLIRVSPGGIDAGNGLTYEITNFHQVPEPGTLGLLSLGLIGLSLRTKFSRSS